MAADFERMRAQLVEKGLIAKVGGEYRLTDRGHEHAMMIIRRISEKAKA